jgi:hypothetical protein
MEKITIMDINKKLISLIDQLGNVFYGIDYKIDFGNCHCNKSEHKNKMLVHLGPFPIGTNKSNLINDLIIKKLESPYFSIVHKIWNEKYLILTIDEKYKIHEL